MIRPLEMKDNYLGFTLIELMVVIAIIGILAVVVVLAISPVAMIQKGRDANRKSDLATLSKAIDIDLANQVPGETATVPGGSGPTGTGNSNTSYNDDCCGGTDGATCPVAQIDDASDSGWLVDWWATCASTQRNLNSYIGRIPTDPISSSSLYYRYDTNAAGDKYCLEAVMENPDSGTSYKAGSDLSGCILP